MSESLHSKSWRWLANLAPAYRRTGARVSYVASDFKRVDIRLPLTWQTRNHLNMIWGGSLYAALDPVYGVMLHKLLGKEYYVVDKAATIHFQRPARTQLHARFEVDDHELDTIRNLLKTQEKIDRVYRVELKDKDGKVYTVCDKTVHVRRKTELREPV